jgi:hypothetical protein
MWKKRDLKGQSELLVLSNDKVPQTHRVKQTYKKLLRKNNEWLVMKSFNIILVRRTISSHLDPLFLFLKSTSSLLMIIT